MPSPGINGRQNRLQKRLRRPEGKLKSTGKWLYIHATLSALLRLNYAVCSRKVMAGHSINGRKHMSGISIRNLAAFGLITALLFGVSTVAKAQEPPPGVNAAKILEIKEKLGLSDEQVAKLKTLLESEKAELTPLVKKQLADLKTLDEKVKANAPDDELDPILDNMETRRQNIESAKSKYIGQARAILTPTQQAKVVLAGAVLKVNAFQNISQRWRGKVK
jgi:Spy/CpxP family protein refolding chaperone